MTGWLSHVVTELLHSEDFAEDETLLKLGHCMSPGIIVQNFFIL